MGHHHSSGSVFLFVSLLLLVYTVGISSGADHVDSRCACKCPEAAWFDIESSWEERKIYINSSVEAADCDCEHVVVPLLKLDVEMAEKFCPRCLCKAETRSVLTIKVVVGLIIWVLALLLIYLGYLVCLEPLLTGSPRPRATGQYRHHQDEQEINDSVGGSEGIGDGTPMSQYSSRGAARSVVNRIGVNQDRWRRQVEVQRSSVYDRHSLLN